MSVDYKKLGLDRVATSIASSVKPVTNRASTGDITLGTVVSVRVGANATSTVSGTARVPARSTGALLLQNAGPQLLKLHWISAGILNVELNAAATGQDLSFWVF